MSDTPDYQARTERLGQALGEWPGAAFVTNQPADLEYLTGVPSSPGWLLVVPGRRPLLLIDEARWNGARAQALHADAERFRPRDSVGARLAALCSAHGVRQLVCEDLPLSMVDLLTGDHQLAITRTPPLLSQLRRRKDPLEQRMLRAAAGLADSAMDVARRTLRAGVTELQVAAEVDRHVKVEGGDGTWFPTVVSSGARAAHPVYPATRKVIEPGDMVVVDIGLKLDGYGSDITRTFIVGGADPRTLEILEVVLEAQRHALAAVRSGVPVEDVDHAARRIFDERGFGQYVTHAVGHGLGLAKEYPTLASGLRELLVAGECVTVEPGIYLPDVGGARIEDEVLVRDDGAEMLTHFPKDLARLLLSSA
jgi:Xaa-Pro aminopeptidase